MADTEQKGERFRVGNRDVEIANLDLMVRAYALRSKSRMSYAEIGKRLNVSKGKAYRLVTRNLRLFKMEAVDEYRRTVMTRLDVALAAIMPQVIAGSLPAIKALVDISKEQALLMGIEAATKINLSATVLSEEAWAALSDDGLARILHGESIDKVLQTEYAAVRLLAAPGPQDEPAAPLRADGGAVEHLETGETGETVLHDAGPEVKGVE